MSAHVPQLEELRRAASQSGFRVKPFADLLGLEVRTLERRFDEMFGCSPQEWLAQLRMRDGMALLEAGWSTKEVAAALGFRDRSSLFREFRQRVGCTPCAWAGEPDRATFSQRIPSDSALSQTATLLSQSATPRHLRLAAAL